jgi:diadenosine tetraphosphate (Ap4A) HIT family hydrolase
MLEEFRKKFQVADLQITDGDHWTLSVRPLQPTIGSLILSVNRELAELSELSQSESEALGVALRQAAASLKVVFKPDKINVFCLMLIDPLVHFHIIPRYSRVVEFAGRRWADKDWPGQIDITANQADHAAVKMVQKELMIL